MGSCFSVEMLPAREGDCLWIEYGDQAEPKIILCDGGRKSAYQALRPRLRSLAEAGRAIELLIITHIDADHIEGILELINEEEFSIQVKDVWFNGYQHLKLAEHYLLDEKTLGARQAEALTLALTKRGWPWNCAFEGRPVAKESNEPTAKLLAGGMSMTILSPTYDALASLIPSWEAECARAGIKPGFGLAGEPKERNDIGDEALSIPPTVEEAAIEPFVADRSRANRSSIAILAEFQGRCLLLAADAHADILIESIAQLGKTDTEPLRLDAFKLSHHGSKGTNSSGVFELIDASALLISTDGTHHGHPDRQALARWAIRGLSRGTLYFNYRQPAAEFWNQIPLKQKYCFEVMLPAPDLNGHMKLSLI